MVVVIETHTEPVLTHTQFWDGVVNGLCNNHELVPTITPCKVLSQTEEELVLLQTLDGHTTIGQTAGEHKNKFVLSPPSKVDISIHPYMHTHSLSPITSPTSSFKKTNR